MEWVWQTAEQYGLFVALVVYVLYTNQKREDRYITIIDKQSDVIKQDLGEIKNSVLKLEQRVGG